MADLTDAELDEFEAMIGYWELGDGPSVESLEALVAEVRRWRDQAADEAGLARLAAEIGRLAESVDHLGRKGPGGLAGFGEMDVPPGWEPVAPGTHVLGAYPTGSVGSPGGADA